MEKNSETELGAWEGGGSGLPYAQGQLCPWYGHLAAFVLIIVAVFLIYAKTLHYPFIIDDTLYITDNPYIMDLSNFFPPFGTRYLVFLSFALNYHFGGFDPASFRFVNIVIHAANAILVYILVTRTLATPSMERLRKRPGLGFCLALSVALIFATHPMQTQAVTYITQRFASLVTLFYIAAMILYVQWRTSEGGRKRRVVFYILALVTAIAAQMTKEISFTLPFSILLYEFVFFGIERSGLRRRVVLLVPFLLTMLIIPINLFGPDIGLMGEQSSITADVRDMQLAGLEGVSSYYYLLTQFRVVVKYLGLLVLPMGQMFKYDIDFFTSIFVPEVFASFIFLLGVFSAAVYLLLISLKKGGLKLLVSFGILFFFVTISIESSIIPIQDPMFEHRVYLPIVGASLAFSAFFFMLFGYVEVRFGKRFSLAVATALLILLTAVPLGVAANKRNTVWSDKVTFFMDELKKRSGNAEAHKSLGSIYAGMGKWEDAISEFKAAIRADPVNPKSYNNLGKAYASLGLFEEALDSFSSAVVLKPDFWDAHYSMARVYERVNKLDEAVSEYQLLTRHLPKNASMRFFLGEVYERLGRQVDAIEEYSMALVIDPGFFMAYFRMGGLYASAGHVREAATAYRKFIDLAPVGYEREKSQARSYIKMIEKAARQHGKPG